MKSQQRTFVVEFKSARRRSTTRPESIWADTDLKAHVRDAEADAPHLFEPNMVSKTPDQSSELPADSKLETHLNDKAETGDAGQISASLAKAEQTYPPPQDNDPNSGSVSKLKKNSSSVWRSPSASKRRREAGVNHQADGTKSTPRVRSSAAQVEAASDELVALDEENRRLKGLLAKHLLLQNTQLRTMLVRFAVI
jgi:hypothetical protein